MSRIYFHSESDGDAELSGAERAMMGVFIGNIATSILDVNHESDKIFSLIDPSAYITTTRFHRPEHVRTDFKNWFNHGNGSFTFDGHSINPLELALNTTMAIGNDVARLMARFHGQCEIHCWIDGPNRAWLASIIQSGIESRVLRNSLHGSSLGWDTVISHLLARDTEPVVCSYSVCDKFPNADIAGIKSERKWEKMSDKKKWKAAMDGLRREPSLEIKPEGFSGYRFGHGKTVMDLRNWADEVEYASRPTWMN